GHGTDTWHSHLPGQTPPTAAPAKPCRGFDSPCRLWPSFEFIGRDLIITKVRGRFPEVSGTITIDDQPERSHIEVVLKVASIDIGNPDRDGQLRSADFFDADKYPTITFRSTEIEPGTSGTWAVTGDLTVLDVTRPITLKSTSTAPTPHR